MPPDLDRFGDYGLIPFAYDDGGRAAAGFRGDAGDCAARAAAIATDLPYREAYDAINELARTEPPRGRRGRSNARTGVYRPVLARFLEAQRFCWVSTMAIGSGCRVHLRADELPAAGRIVLRLSRHYAAVVDGVLRDTYDCSRDGTRCVYGYWQLEDE